MVGFSPQTGHCRIAAQLQLTKLMVSALKSSGGDE